jgi:hypothetical protein
MAGLVLLQQRRQTRAATRRGVAADAGIDHLRARAFLLEFLRQQLHPACAARQAVFGTQGVPDHQNARGFGRERRHTKALADKGQQAQGKVTSSQQRCVHA